MKTVVKMFQPRFADLVAAREKLQTVRKTPKGPPPEPGDVISCRKWSDAPYRSPQIHLYHSVIVSVDPVTIDEDSITINGVPAEKQEFALADGFRCWTEMLDWFKFTHSLPFTGILIKWN